MVLVFQRHSGLILNLLVYHQNNDIQKVPVSPFPFLSPETSQLLNPGGF
ncbi:unnamed protein product [Schistosoma mattheei]|uniref:Uncharacterized protein n=1 Tax=Schistosoma mattheei TaxID=31246 RepID=A0A3P8JLP6_9TREM|nr:unnamed protein product [Schistosoma mattheei]